MNSHSHSQQYPSMTSFFTGHILGPHRGTVPFSKHHEQRTEDWVRERACSLWWISIQLESSDSPRRPSAGSDRSSAAHDGLVHFAPLVFRALLPHCFWTLTEVASTEYTFSQSIGLLETHRDSLLRGEMRMDRRRKGLKTEQERIDKEDDLCQS